MIKGTVYGRCRNRRIGFKLYTQMHADVNHPITTGLSKSRNGFQSRNLFLICGPWGFFSRGSMWLWVNSGRHICYVKLSFGLACWHLASGTDVRACVVECLFSDTFIHTLDTTNHMSFLGQGRSRPIDARRMGCDTTNVSDLKSIYMATWMLW